MPQNLKILVSAYACSPNKGSEPGIGWNFVLGLSHHHKVYVIVEKRKWEVPINTFLSKNPKLNQDLKFYFIDKKRNKPLRKIWPPSYYWYYNKWQKKAYKLALQLDEEENFDIIHQLNMTGYREPGYLWKINKPFVWGPIGGLENSPWRFLPSLGFMGMLFFTGRNLMNLWQRNFNLRIRKAVNHKQCTLIAATPGVAKRIKKSWNTDTIVMSEIGQEKIEASFFYQRASTEPLKIIWSGLHIPRKNLPLLFRALKDVDFHYELQILGEGEMTSKWQKQANKFGINKYCNWLGWLEHEKAIKLMSTGHVFCITSISELTSTVTLEALSCGLPIVCLDHLGFAHVVNEQCGIKIKVNTHKRAARNFAIALEKFYRDENYRQNLSRGAIQRAKDFCWEKKIEQLNTIYYRLLNQEN